MQNSEEYIKTENGHALEARTCSRFFLRLITKPLLYSGKVLEISSFNILERVVPDGRGDNLQRLCPASTKNDKHIIYSLEIMFTLRID
jgi:hypothetical protein